ncbi:hypothetical protein C8F01DRAFT_1262510 [Mycena amicta]|nr:hypothetical protein C8F01DRAFT_1262510 [Mycena amicta]
MVAYYASVSNDDSDSNEETAGYRRETILAALAALAALAESWWTQYCWLGSGSAGTWLAPGCQTCQTCQTKPARLSFADALSLLLPPCSPSGPSLMCHPLRVPSLAGAMRPTLPGHPPNHKNPTDSTTNTITRVLGRALRVEGDSSRRRRKGPDMPPQCQSSFLGPIICHILPRRRLHTPTKCRTTSFHLTTHIIRPLKHIMRRTTIHTTLRHRQETSPSPSHLLDTHIELFIPHMNLVIYRRPRPQSPSPVNAAAGNTAGWHAQASPETSNVSTESPTDPDHLIASHGERQRLQRSGYYLLYFYDFLLTLPEEWEFHLIFDGPSVYKGCFIILRYIPMLYQSGIILGMFQDNWNLQSQSCTTWGTVLMSLDTISQATYACLLSTRIWMVVNRYLAIPVFLLGILPPIIDIVFSYPSVFPQCRLMNPTPVKR